ncbi:MAG: protoporphyrinogen oxidase HemJ [Paracoccaceae bacterium]
MLDMLSLAYPWVKALHIAAVISWMAGIFYLPRLYVYHAERASVGSELSETLKVMEMKLLRVIMNPAMIVTWLAGIALALTPGIIDWSEIWPWMKLAMILGMTWFHHSLGLWRKTFDRDENSKPGSYYRKMNEVPTVLMLVIVVMVVVRPF